MGKGHLFEKYVTGIIIVAWSTIVSFDCKVTVRVNGSTNRNPTSRYDFSKVFARAKGIGLYFLVFSLRNYSCCSYSTVTKIKETTSKLVNQEVI